MFDTKEVEKKFEEVLDRTQSAYEFWIKAVFVSVKDMLKAVKNK